MCLCCRAQIPREAGNVPGSFGCESRSWGSEIPAPSGFSAPKLVCGCWSLLSELISRIWYSAHCRGLVKPCSSRWHDLIDQCSAHRSSLVKPCFSWRRALVGSWHRIPLRFSISLNTSKAPKTVPSSLLRVVTFANNLSLKFFLRAVL